MTDPKLEILENRVKDLEQKVFGDNDKDAVYPKVCVGCVFGNN